MAEPAPDLGIPPSVSTVDVSIIDTTASVRGVPANLLLAPPVEGYDWLAVPVFSFLIHHPTLKRSVIFDLGIRKDWHNLSPSVVSRIKRLGWTVNVEKDVSEILTAGGVDVKTVEAIIWSHHHFDHTGNPNTFPSSTSLIVGPGFKATMLPGYPANPDSPVLESDFANRQLIELDFSPASASGTQSPGGGTPRFAPLSIGRFRALDYFNDGSFYLLDTPGHATGHISALARQESFILLTGDAIHHLGEIRPSRYLPLPENVVPDPFAPDPHPLESHYGCPGAVFARPLLAGRGRPPCGPIYEPARVGRVGNDEKWNEDVDALLDTVSKLQEADAHDNVFVAAAHDETLLDHVVFFPEGTMNEFAHKRWVTRVRWRFLRDFAAAVGKLDHEFGRRYWGPEKSEA
ncbi:beta-lactamase-like protein [Corynascus novoguineensis]|uniref:Beta-lactamase-like protein n=1 Tax=Corynascus novoguineensis TaxID=1126955 RepID=A0AAN7CPM4_9PEZI|nr:beta-lactamase-like protein [Corynascus novoguineensis]